MEAEDIPIDLFHDLRGTQSSGASFFPFSQYDQRNQQESQSEHQQKQLTKNRNRILKIAELVSNLSDKNNLSSILKDLPLSGTDLEDLIHELEFRGKRQTAFFILEEIYRNGLSPISVQFCEDYIQHLFQKQCPTSEFLHLLHLLHSSGLKLSSNCYYTIAMFLIEQGELLNAIEVIRTQDKDKSLVEICNEVIEMCLINDRLMLGFKIYDQLTAVHKMEPNLKTFTSLMTCAFRCHDDERLFSYLKDLKSRGINPDLYIYNLLIKASERMNDIETGLRHYEEMINEAKIQPNMKTYNALIRLCGRNGLFKESLELFDELQKTGNRPSLLTFNSLLSSSVRAQQPKKTFELFEKMTDSYRISPNALIYTSLIRACVQTKDLTKALELLEEMKHRRLEMDVMVYSGLVQVCGSCKDAKTALMLLHEMLSKGIQPNEITKKAFVQICFLNPSDLESFQIIEDLKRCGLRIEADAYRILIRNCDAVGDEKGASKWRTVMASKGVIYAS